MLHLSRLALSRRKTFVDLCVEFFAYFLRMKKKKKKRCALAMVLNAGGPHLGQPQADLKNAGPNCRFKATVDT